MTGSEHVVAVANGGYADRHWHHVAATFEAGVARLYVDGALVASSAAAGMLPSETNSSITFGGSATLKTKSAFGGYLDEVRDPKPWDNMECAGPCFQLRQL